MFIFSREPWGSLDFLPGAQIDSREPYLQNKIQYTAYFHRMALPTWCAMEIYHGTVDSKELTGLPGLIPGSPKAIQGSPGLPAPLYFEPCFGQELPSAPGTV